MRDARLLAVVTPDTAAQRSPRPDGGHLTSQADLDNTMRQLEYVNAKVVGFVYNDASQKGRAYGYKYGKYGKYGKYAKRSK